VNVNAAWRVDAWLPRSHFNASLHRRHHIALTTERLTAALSGRYRIERELGRVASIDDYSSPKAVISSPAREAQPRVSPDGRWLAYASDQSGQFEVYVTSFPTPSARVKVSESGGAEPLWSRDGRVLYYRVGAQVIAASLATPRELAITARTVALVGDYERDARTGHANYDIAPDGKSFLVLRPVNGGNPPIIAYHWDRELKALVRGKRPTEQ
jgi:hypothetical protein